MAHPNFLENTRVLIIGGSSGIGFAVASAALSNKSKVHITSMTASKLSSKISTLQSFYPGAHVSGSVTDLSNTETLEGNLQSVLEAALKETGGALDHIVFTAGDSATLFPLAEATAEKALKPFTVRYLGSLLVGKLVAANPDKYLKTSAASSITFTSGIGVRRPNPGAVALVGVGGAVEVLGRALAVDLAPIRVNVVISGQVDTELLQRIIGGRPQVLEKFKAGTLTGQIGTPQGAAEAYVFCMRSALATGQSFVIDNGTTANPVMWRGRGGAGQVSSCRVGAETRECGRFGAGRYGVAPEDHWGERAGVGEVQGGHFDWPDRHAGGAAEVYLFCMRSVFATGQSFVVDTGTTAK